MPNIQSILIAVIASALLSGLGTWKFTHTYDLAKLEKVELGYKDAAAHATAEAARIQKAQDEAALTATIAANAAQTIIVTQTEIVQTEVVRHVKDTVACPSYGFVRVLDAEVLGRSPDDLPLPAGTTDDTCAPIGFTALAQSIIANYAIARENAEQLNDLENTITAFEAVVPLQSPTEAVPKRATRP